MEDDIKIKWKRASQKKGGRPKKKWKMTSKKIIGRRPKKNERQPQKKMEDDLKHNLKNQP